MKEFSKHKQRLLVLAEGVNAFSSEPVQLKVISWLLDHPEILFKENEVIKEIPDLPVSEPAEQTVTQAARSKVISPKSIPVALKELLSTGFFNEPKTIVEITNFCNGHFLTAFFPNNISAGLKKLIDTGALSRQHSEELKRYVYRKQI